MANCSPYATDTITIGRDTACVILPARFRSFSGLYYAADKKAELKWSVTNNSLAGYFVVQASVDGGNFTDAGIIQSNKNLLNDAAYSFNYTIPFGVSSYIDFRIKMISDEGSYTYTRIIRINIKPPVKSGIIIAPNPVRGKFQMNVASTSMHRQRSYSLISWPHNYGDE